MLPRYREHGDGDPIPLLPTSSVYACCLLGARTMSQTAFSTEPRPLGYANLSDIPTMTVSRGGGQATRHVTPAKTAAGRVSLSCPPYSLVAQDDDNFVCCITETIFETKNKLYDCFVKGRKVSRGRSSSRLLRVKSTAPTHLPFFMHAWSFMCRAFPLHLAQLLPSNETLRSLFKVSSADNRRFLR